MVWGCFEICIAEATLAIRKVFGYGMADWASIHPDLAAFDWRLIDRESAERCLHNTLFSNSEALHPRTNASRAEVGASMG